MHVSRTDAYHAHNRPIAHDYPPKEIEPISRACTTFPCTVAPSLITFVVAPPETDSEPARSSQERQRERNLAGDERVAQPVATMRSARSNRPLGFEGFGRGDSDRLDSWRQAKKDSDNQASAESECQWNKSNRDGIGLRDRCGQKIAKLGYPSESDGEAQPTAE